MKKLSVALTVILLASVLCLPGGALVVGAPAFEVKAEGVYLYNLDTQSLIWEQSAGNRVNPAALTKIMTCIIALESTDNLDSDIVTYPDYVQDYLYSYQIENGTEITLAGLMAKEEITMRQALYALMLRSANEVAMSIADHVGGSQGDFVAMMNAKAKELGANNTHFTNATGLYDEGQYTTAEDMAIISMYAWSLPGFQDIVTEISYESGPTNMHENLVWNSLNYMQNPANDYYYSYVKGIMPSTHEKAGRSFVSTATKDGFTYLLVVLGAPYYDDEGNALESNAAFAYTQRIYEWAFDNYRQKALVEKGKYVKEVPLRLSMDKDYLQLMTADRYTALVPNSIEASSVTMIFDVPDYVEAPVSKGDRIGTATLILSGEEIGVVDLVSAENVAASPVLSTLESVKGVFRSFWFKFAVIFIVLAILVYLFLMITRNRRRRRSRSYKPRRRI